MKRIAVVMVVLLGAACGKDGGAGGAGGGSGGDPDGPSCAHAAAKYVDLLLQGGGSPLYSLKPSPDQVKAVSAVLEADCTASWSAETRSCLMAAKPDLQSGKCWTERGASLRVSQIVFDFAKAEKAKPAVVAPPAAGSGSGSAAAAAGSASAPIVLPPAGAGSAIAAGSGSDPGSAASSAAAPIAESTELKVGDRVSAKWTNGSWYPGKISAVNADGTYNVNYDDGDRSKNLPLAKVKKRAKPTGGGGGASSSSASDAPCPGPGLTRRCSGRCVNIQEDDNNCGGCGNVCSGGKHCDGHMFCRDADGNL